MPLHWEHALSAWQTWLKLGGRSRNTLRLRRDHLKMIARASETTCPRQLTLELLINIIGEHDWSNEYRKSLRTSLNQFGEWAVANGVMDDNPAALLPSVPGDRPRPRPAPDEVWLELLEQASPREQLMARLAGEAGLRRTEVAQCHRDDLIRDREGWALIVLGKGAKQRVVPITDALAATIIASCPAGFLFPGRTKMTGRRGGHLSPEWVGTVLSKLMPPGWTMHKLRHRFATRGYAGTGNLRAVQEALGHSSVATTERYVAVSRNEVRRVAEAAAPDRGPDAA